MANSYPLTTLNRNALCAKLLLRVTQRVLKTTNKKSIFQYRELSISERPTKNSVIVAYKKWQFFVPIRKRNFVWLSMLQLVF